MSHDAHTQPLDAVQIDDPEAGQTWVAAIAGVIVLAALVVGICAFYFRYEGGEVTEKVIEPADQWLTALKSEQMKEITVYQKYSVTAPDGSTEERIRITVARAMELVIEESKAVPAAGVDTK